MYVRWQQYRSKARNPRQRERNDERARLRAILVESVRVDGKYRQKHIAYLGSVTSDAVAEGKSQSFWYHVSRRLQQVRLSPKDRQRIAALIAERVSGALMTTAQMKKREREIKARCGV
jgi:hypothetical protein